MKRMQSAPRNVFLPRQHLSLHRLGHFGAKTGDLNHAFAHTTPHLASLPSAVQHRLGALGVVAAPLVGDRHDLRIGGHLAHVRVIRHRQLATLLGGHHHRRGAGVKSDHIHALVEQRHGRIALARWVKPGVQPDHFDHRLGVDRLHAQGKGVDAL